MQFEQFLDEMEALLTEKYQDRFPLAGTVAKKTLFTSKGNRADLTYITENSTREIGLNMKEAYQEFKRGLSMDNLANKILWDLRQKLAKDLDMLENNERTFTLDRIVPVLIPTKGNEKWLKTMPHIPMENLQVIFYFVPADYNLNYATVVSNDHMKRNGWEAKKLFEISKENSIFKEQVSVAPLWCMPLETTEIVMEEDMNYLRDMKPPLIVVTNKQKNYGASAILESNMMGKLAEAYNNDLYIFPSSLHECIVHPKDESMLEDMRKMVYDINRAVVEPDDRLSDEVYLFDKNTRQISIACEQRERETNLIVLPEVSLSR